MILNPGSLYMSKSEKILFSTAVFINFVFYGILAVSLYFGLPNSYISGISRIIVMLISFYLFFDSLVKKEFGDITFTWPFFAYAAYCALLLFITNFSGSSSAVAEYGRIYFIYIYLGYAIAPFLLFLMPPKRFYFLANNPWLVYIPSLLSMVLIAVFFSHFYLGIESDSESPVSLNRANVTAATAMTLVMSLYYIIFPKNVLKNIMGLLSMILVALAMMKSSSQSLLLSVAIVIIVVVCFSFRMKRALIKVGIGGMLAAIALIPVLVTSTGFQRLMMITDIDLYYIYGGKAYDYSRIDLIFQAWDVFLSSPVIGGNLYLDAGGTYSHFFPSDVLMVCGILGFPFLIYIFYILAQSFFVSLAKLPLSYCWLVMLIAYMFVESLVHGSYSVPILFHISIALTLAKMYRDYPFGIPDLSDDAPKDFQRPMHY